MHRDLPRPAQRAALCRIYPFKPARRWGLVLAMAAAVWRGGFISAEVTAPKSESRQGTERMDDADSRRVPSFHVFAVTGPHMNRSVCYVCRNGERPVVMVLSRRVAPPLAELLKGIDAIVDRHRAAGLRSFAVLLSDDARSDAPRLQTLAFDERIDTPLTLAPTVMSRQPWLRLADDTELCVVLYRNRRILARHTIQPGDRSAADVRRALDAVRALAADADAAAGLRRK